MKKIYILALVAFGFSVTANAQFTDNMEDYLAGDPISDQSGGLWRTWSDDNGGAEDAIVSTDQASDGVNSLYVGAGNDMLLFMGPQTGGTYTWEYKVYLNDGSAGFLGLMSEATVSFGLALYHNNATIGSSFSIGASAVGDPLVIPQDEWVTFTWVMDLDADTAVVSMNGTEVYNGDLALGGTLDAVDIWDDGTADFYMDEVVLVEGLLGSEDFNADVFTVYPNPVVDVLNINSQTAVDGVVVYDILGKVVLSANPGVASPSIDMSSLASGAYLVNVTIGDASKTIKVIK